MPAVLLSVQFRNVLPSEELLLRARSLWSALQSQKALYEGGDATLRITQIGGDSPASFEVELTLPCSDERASAHGVDVYRAMIEVFQALSDAGAAQIDVVREDGLAAAPALGKSATLSHVRGCTDTLAD
jgi:hypothetical protein